MHILITQSQWIRNPTRHYVWKKLDTKENSILKNSHLIFDPGVMKRRK
jgi:hypothetical protein